MNPPNTELAALATANQLWTDYNKIKKSDLTFVKKDISQKISHFQTAGYNDFITKYAVPTRYMLQYDEYNSSAFKKYLMRLKDIGYKSKDEWCDRQADYVKLLWRAYNVHGNNKEANAQWQYARDSIHKEMTGFETDYDNAKLKSEDRRKLVIADHRNTLLQLVNNDARSKKHIEALYNHASESHMVTNVNQPAISQLADVSFRAPRSITETEQRVAAREARRNARKTFNNRIIQLQSDDTDDDTVFSHDISESLSVAQLIL